MTKDRAWNVGFGPVLFKAGEMRRIDVQSKCYFRVEKIVPYPDIGDAHLSGLFVGQKEVLQLGGDTIDLRKKEIVVEAQPWCDPANTMEIEIVNRSPRDQMICVDIAGTARL